MTPHVQITSWTTCKDHCQFIDSVNGHLVKVKEGSLAPLDSVSANSGSIRRDMRIQLAYETIHDYIEQNKKKLGLNDAELIEALAGRITEAGVSLNCKDPRLQCLYSFAEKLRNVNSQDGKATEKTSREILRSLKVIENPSTTSSLNQDALTIYNLLGRKTTCGEVLDNNQVENAFEDPKLKCCVKDVVRCGNGEYVHANRIYYYGMRHIASQAPQSDLAKERFWKMACLIPGNLIVDLITEKDIKNFPQLQFIYTEQSQASFFGSMKVEFLDLRKKGPINIYRYKVQQLDQEKKPIDDSQIVTRIRYQGWQDFSKTDANQIKKIISVLDEEIQGQNTIPIVCCKDGAGRTGTFITARIIKQLSCKYKITQKDFQTGIEEIILFGRERRGPWFVNNLSQIKTLLGFSATLQET